MAWARCRRSWPRRPTSGAPSCVTGVEVVAVSTDGERATITTAGRPHDHRPSGLRQRRPGGARSDCSGSRRPATARRAPRSRSTCCCRGCRACATGRCDPSRRSPARSTSTRATASWSRAYRQAAAGVRAATLAPCEIYCHSLTDPTILGARPAGRRGADADAVRPAHAGPAVPRRSRRARWREATASILRSLDSVLDEPIEDCLLDARLHRGHGPAGDRGRPRDARRPHLPPRPAVAVRRAAPGTRAAGASRPPTPTSSCAAPAPAAAAASRPSPAATRPWPRSASDAPRSR